MVIEYKSKDIRDMKLAAMCFILASMLFAFCAGILLGTFSVGHLILKILG